MTLFLHGTKVPFTLCEKSLEDVAGYLLNLKPCKGVQTTSLQGMKGPTFTRSIDSGQSCLRSKVCAGAADEDVHTCRSCMALEVLLKRRLRRRKCGTLGKKAPWKRASKKQLLTTLRAERQERKALEALLPKPSEEVDVDEEVHNSLKTIVQTTQEAQVPAFVKTFWQQQVTNISRNPNGKRWSPEMIRLALLVHSQSPQAYRTLRSTGLLQLPGETTLRDYSNASSPSQGFQPEVKEYSL